MPVKMAPHQLAFWRELLAPFDPNQLSVTKRGGKDLTYVDKRSVYNRLDSVCGPFGWTPEFTATERGYKCRLSILCPTADPDVSVWIAKEDGAGFEEMGQTNKTTGEFEYDVDNDEKSGYTNAARRAAQDAWGIGRYLYKKGIPTFLDPNAVNGQTQATPGPLPVVAPAGKPIAPSAPPAELREPATPPPNTRDQANPAEPPRKFDNFKIPKPGSSVFAWAKEMENHYETKLIDGMQGVGEKMGFGSVVKAWDEVQVKAVVKTAIDHIRGLPNYKGEYEAIFANGQANQTQVNPAVRPGVNVADLRKLLMARMSALITKHSGNAATNPELKSALTTVSVSSKTGNGDVGEVCVSLAKCEDAGWITNMIAYVDGKIAESVAFDVTGELVDADIPF
jgi:hypothetical protein